MAHHTLATYLCIAYISGPNGFMCYTTASPRISQHQFDGVGLETIWGTTFLDMPHTVTTFLPILTVVFLDLVENKGSDLQWYPI